MLDYAKRALGKDPVMFASGRLSDAVRNGHSEEIIALRRRELRGAQVEKALNRLLADGIGLTPDRAKHLCKMLMDASVAA